MTKSKAKNRKRPAAVAGAARGSAHVCCPTCGGSGKLPRESVKVTRYQWKAKGVKKTKRDKMLTSFLTITTVSAPNAPGEPLPPEKDSKRH